MITNADVVVIGAGAFGASTAYYLVRHTAGLMPIGSLTARHLPTLRLCALRALAL